MATLKCGTVTIFAGAEEVAVVLSSSDISRTSARACRSAVRACSRWAKRRVTLRRCMQRPASRRSAPVRPAMRQSSISLSRGGPSATASLAPSVRPTYLPRLSCTMHTTRSLLWPSFSESARASSSILWSDASNCRRACSTFSSCRALSSWLCGRFSPSVFSRICLQRSLDAASGQIRVAQRRPSSACVRPPPRLRRR